MSQRLSKTDEHMLLGNREAAIRNMLKSVRGIRTRSKRTLEMLDAADRAWPTEGVAEREKMRVGCQQAITTADALEAKLLRERAQ